MVYRCIVYIRLDIYNRDLAADPRSIRGKYVQYTHGYEDRQIEIEIEVIDVHASHENVRLF